jgi:precorrin-2 methylase
MAADVAVVPGVSSVTALISVLGGDATPARG